ncbi:MAG: GNAT family N-acetyltransferase, partial [Anaerolineales bacterium]|nr:GNAT family N-acetyltransferase [Anaerolineales bacterium]
MSGPSASVETAGQAAPIRLLPADRFTIAQLTAAYNQTRVDYLVPMPMNAARLAEYVHVYDVDLSASVVAVDGENILGLAMLGVRPGRSWITRLGVLPTARRHGLGRALLDALLASSDARGLPLTVLEVIKNNAPAYNLFVQCGFQTQHELLVLRRPPGPPAAGPNGQVAWLENEAALALLAERADRASWVTATESIARAGHVQALMFTSSAGQGWLVFQVQTFHGLPMLLTRLTLHTRAGDPVQVGSALLAHLYARFPDLDTQAENVATDDP